MSKLGVLGVYRQPVPLTFHKDVSPEVVSAGVFTVASAFFVFVASYDGDVVEETDLHVDECYGFEFVAARFQPGQMLSFGLSTQRAKEDPVICKQAPQRHCVLVLVRFRPLVLDFSELRFQSSLIGDLRLCLRSSGLTEGQGHSRRNEQNNRYASFHSLSLGSAAGCRTGF